ncbi:YhgE/Pip domain-containing protein [Paenibacillus xylanilyticus]|uniref:YhgE/Pip domain-containing protein n=1 Tax=Paenibacillus xylanilyticus TaxID=248903 RepID=UPI0039A0D289
MTVFSVLKDFFKILQTKIGLVFAFVVPLIFTIVWLTGYNGATERVDQLSIGIVNSDGAQGQSIEKMIKESVPYKTENYSTLEEAQQVMNDGDIGMIVSIPAQFSANMDEGKGELTYYVNQAASDVSRSILEGSAEGISTSVGAQLSGIVQKEVVTTNVVKTNNITNFALSMLPMILGFITYIAVMTMNIQLNLSTMMLSRKYDRWNIFWARQLLLLIVCIVAPLIITSVAMLFVTPVASFWEMWGFHILVYIACVCLTQMSFVLFGGLGALFNVGMIPFQLMTAGNIIATEMLTPFYRHIGDFLPASNAVRGYVRLIYSGTSVTSIVINLILIAVVTWGITVARMALHKSPAAGAATSAH